MLDTSNARKFNNSLKKAIKEAGINVRSVEIINSYNWPACRVRVYADNFPNEFRLKCFDATGADRKGLLNVNDVSYGTIQPNWISLNVQTWQKMFL